VDFRPANQFSRRRCQPATPSCGTRCAANLWLNSPPRRNPFYSNLCNSTLVFRQKLPLAYRPRSSYPVQHTCLTWLRYEECGGGIRTVAPSHELPCQDVNRSRPQSRDLSASFFCRPQTGRRDHPREAWSKLVQPASLMRHTGRTRDEWTLNGTH